MPVLRSAAVLISLVLSAAGCSDRERTSSVQEPAKPVVAPLSAELTPWVFEFDEASSGITHFGDHLNHIPAGKMGPLQISQDGHFQLGEGRIRFWGVNITGASCFPSRDDAAAIAGRLAKLGVNIVRFHHMDHRWNGPSLIDYTADSSRAINNEALDRLDYFISRLKSQGIYINLNLLTAREFLPGDGLPGDIAAISWKQRQALGFVLPEARTLEKEYARKLLHHVNPYTGMRYADDPAIAIVEINNENGLLHQYLDGATDEWPKYAADQLQKRWNDWLANRYTSTSALKEAWDAEAIPLGEERVFNPGFANGLSGWNLEVHGKARASIAAGRFSGERAVQVNIRQLGAEAWHVQLSQSGLSLKKGHVYTLSFRAKANKERQVTVNMQNSLPPWNSYKYLHFQLDNEWRRYSATFVSPVTHDSLRLTFSELGRDLGQIHFADISLRKGGALVEMSSSESLEFRTVASNRSDVSYSQRRATDWIRFLYALEENYWSDMKTFLKDELGVVGLTYGTIASVSPPSVQRTFDFIDGHAYWCHPVFPEMQWDENHWSVCNRSMVNHPENNILNDLAYLNVEGMPFTVSEYQHALPNSYAAEGPLLAAAYGAFQDWDAIYFFSYDSDPSGSWRDYRYSGFFQMNQHPALTANFAVGANLFRRYDVASAQHRRLVTLDREDEIERVASRGRPWDVLGGMHAEFPPGSGLVSGTGLRIIEGTDVMPDHSATSNKKEFRSDTSELTWTIESRDRGVVTIDTDKTKAVVGFVENKQHQLGSVSIAPGELALDWATVAVTAQAGSFSRMAEGMSILVLATGLTENTNMAWLDTGRTALGSNWGQSPTKIEIVPFTVTLPVESARVQAWALTAAGERKQSMRVDAAGDGTLISNDPNSGSLWYEIVISAE